jgi:hypothetical protein
MAKYIVKQHVYGNGGAIVRKAGTTVTLKDDAVIDPVLFKLIEEVEDKKIEVATPKPKAKALDE